MSLKSITTFLCLIKYRIELKKCILLTMQKRLSSLHSLLFSQNTLLAPYDGNISFCPFDDVNNNFSIMWENICKNAKDKNKAELFKKQAYVLETIRSKYIQTVLTKKQEKVHWNFSEPKHWY